MAAAKVHPCGDGSRAAVLLDGSRMGGKRGEGLRFGGGPAYDEREAHERRPQEAAQEGRGGPGTFPVEPREESLPHAPSLIFKLLLRKLPSGPGRNKPQK